MGSSPYILANLENLSPIYTPLKSTQRIRYTCFAVSKSLLIFGATSGGLYVFRREPCVFLQLLPNKEGAINHVSISLDEQLFAFATVKGAVLILERNNSTTSRNLHVSSEHIGSEVTSMCWGSQNELYIGDNLGRVSVFTAPFLAKNMFNTPSFQLMQLDSRVVQMDSQEGLLLVSTLSRSFVCDTVKEHYRQIGQKLREGEFGGCFARCTNDIEPHLYCARPGSRIWEASSDGTVLSTHQFKIALAIPPQPVISFSSQPLPSKSTNGDITWEQQSFNFVKLLTLSDNFLFTFKKDGIYIFDPNKASVVLWNNSFTDIVDAATVDNSIYLWTSTGKLYSLMLYPLEKFLTLLYFRKQYVLCGTMCDMYEEWIKEAAPSSSRLHILSDLGEKLDDAALAERLEPLLKELSKHAQQKRRAQRLDSGIFIVGNQYFLCEENTDKVSAPSIPQSRRTDHLKDKSRSLSLSPDRNRRSNVEITNELNGRKSGSHSSLPEINKLSNDDLSNDIDRNMNNYVNEKHPDHNSKYTTSNDNIHIPSMSSPEAIQTLKEIGHSVSWKITNSTKTLRRKWQLLEGKMKNLSQENPLEPFDIKTEENDSVSYEDISSQAGVYEEKQKFNHPNLDLSDLIQICEDYSRPEVSDSDNLQLKFFESIVKQSNKYNYLQAKYNEHNMNSDSNMNSGNGCFSNGIYESETTNFDTTFESKPFPFHHYLPSDMLNTAKQIFHDMFTSKNLVTCLENLVKDVSISEAFIKCFDIISVDSMKLDILVGRFISLCTELLEPDTILQNIRSLELPSYFFSLSTLLEIYQTGALNCLASVEMTHTDSGNTMWPEPFLLNAMYVTMQVGQLETCCSLGKQVQLKDVCYLVLKLEDYMNKQGESENVARLKCYSLFLSFLVRMPNFNENLSKSLNDVFLCQYIASAYESINSNCGIACECGFPVVIKENPKFEEVGATILDHFQRTDHERAMSLCKRVPSLWYQLLRNKTHKCNSDVPLIIQLGCVHELESCASEGDSEFWNRVLSLTFTLRSGNCLNCGSKIPYDEYSTLSQLGAMMVKSIGPMETVQLLKKFSSDMMPGELDSKFYQSCIFAAVVNTQKTGLCRNVVDAVQGVSKSSRVALFSPQAASALIKALKEDGHPPAVESVFWEGAHHWGSRMRPSCDVCPRCCLPLGSRVLMTESPGLTAYPCGHIYHTVCLRSAVATCPLCH